MLRRRPSPPEGDPNATSATPAPAATVLPRGRRGVRRTAVVVTATGVAAAVLAGAALAWSERTSTAVPVVAQEAVHVPTPTLVVATTRGDAKPDWSKPLVVKAVDGAFRSVVVTEADGRPVPGTVVDERTWQSADTLQPAAEYRLAAVVVDGAGREHRLPLVTRTPPAARVVRATLVPGDGAVVGVAMPIRVVLDSPLASKADKALVERRLGLRVTPPQPGAWSWVSDTEVHYRPAQHWRAGTRITATSDLRRLQLSRGTWGSGYRTTTFRVGRALTSTIDINAKTMTVFVDGKPVRVMKASMGKPGFDTYGGTHIVLEKFKVKTMDSATVGITPGSDEYYRTTVQWAVRITNSGTFTHGAPWSVKDQGVRNVSHGCINLSPADAKWFYDRALRGDPVTVVNAVRKPKLWDGGSMHWNVPFAEWAKGSALR